MWVMPSKKAATTRSYWSRAYARMRCSAPPRRRRSSVPLSTPPVNRYFREGIYCSGMHRVADAVARGLIVAALVAPAAAFAAAPSVVSVSSDGLILTSLTPTPYPITVTFDQDVAVAPIVTMVEDGITPQVNDCSDANLATFCFSYDIPQGVEAGLFKNVRIEGAQNAGGETMAPTPPNSHRFIVDSGGPLATRHSAAR